MHSKRISRRNLLKALGVGGLAATPILQRTRAAAAAVPTDLAQLLSQIRQLLGRARWQHAIGDPRGIDIAVLLGRLREGRFGVMFKNLQAFTAPDDLLMGLAAGMVDPRPPLSDVSLSNDG